MKFSIRLLYLYLFSFIGLIISVIGSVRLVQLAIKVYVFNGADEYSFAVRPVSPNGKEMPQIDQEEVDRQKQETQRRRQREVADSIAMLLIGIPLYKYHWSLIKKEGQV